MSESILVWHDKVVQYASLVVLRQRHFSLFYICLIGKGFSFCLGENFSLRKKLNTLLRVTCNEGILALAVVYAVVQLKD